MEYFDILDEDGNKTGRIKLRNEVHRDGDWHKAAHIWIVNPDEGVLLQRRCHTKDSWPDKLDISCAGHLSAGDSSMDGALRELREELGLIVNAEDLKLVCTMKQPADPFSRIVNNEFADIYLLETECTLNDMTFQIEEISEIFFVSKPEFRKMVEEKNLELVPHEEEYSLILKLINA